MTNAASVIIAAGATFKAIVGKTSCLFVMCNDHRILEFLFGHVYVGTSLRRILFLGISDEELLKQYSKIDHQAIG